MIKAVIFDMDGVLIDSEPFWQAAEKVVFKKVGIDITDDMCRQTIGLRIDEVVKHWHQRFPWNHLPLKQVQDEIVQGVIDLVNQKGALLPGVHLALDFFEKKNLKIALASSSDKILIDAVLGKFDLHKDFQIIHSGQDEIRGKPHPAIYLSTAGLLNVDATECLAIEDSFNGLIAAKAARMKTICIPEHSVWNQTKFDIADVKLKSLVELSDGFWKQLCIMISSR
ncbi:hexitol phosphatase HxpB [bacterium]|nr:hexitol phosphatase HxpB [bacterium]